SSLRPRSRFSDAVQLRLARVGYATIRYPVKLDLLQLAQEMGEPVPSRPSAPLVDRLQPTKPQLAKPRSLSGLYGLNEFPFHSEGAYYRVPPRWVLLRLAQGARSDTATSLLDVRALDLPKELLNALHREIWIVAGKPGHFLSPILNSH